MINKYHRWVKHPVTLSCFGSWQIPIVPQSNNCKKLWILLNLLEFPWIFLNLRFFEKHLMDPWTDRRTDWQTDQWTKPLIELLFATKNGNNFFLPTSQKIDTVINLFHIWFEVKIFKMFTKVKFYFLENLSC